MDRDFKVWLASWAMFLELLIPSLFSRFILDPDENFTIFFQFSSDYNNNFVMHMVTYKYIYIHLFYTIWMSINSKLLSCMYDHSLVIQQPPDWTPKGSKIIILYVWQLSGYSTTFKLISQWILVNNLKLSYSMYDHWQLKLNQQFLFNSQYVRNYISGKSFDRHWFSVRRRMYCFW